MATARAPDELASLLNRIVLRELQTETYFTLAYADIDLVSGRTAIVQAGHPHPAVLRAGGGVEFVGSGGYPIGLIEGATYQTAEITLNPGDRLFLMSDGITELPDASGAELGQEGLRAMMGDIRGCTGQGFLDALMQRLDTLSEGDFADDVSGALIEFSGGAAG